MDWFELGEDQEEEARAVGGRRKTAEDFELTKSQSKYELPTGYLSVSQVNLYNECPERYRRKYVEGNRTPGSSNLSQGRLVHEVIDRLNKYKISHGGAVPPAELGQDIISDIGADFFDDVATWDPRNPSQEHAIHYAREIVTLYTRDLLPRLDIRAAELEVFGLVNEAVPFLGYIDIVTVGEANKDLEAADPSLDRRAVKPGDMIGDFKVTGRNYGKHRVANSLQLSVYAGLTRTRDVGYYLLIDRSDRNREANRSPQIKTHKSTRTDTEIRHAYNVVERTAQAISAGNFPLTNPESWMCDAKWCPFYAQCRGAA